MLFLFLKTFRQAAEEAHARWRNGDASESGRKKFKPHRLAIVEERGSEKGASFKEVDVKKFTVCPPSPPPPPRPPPPCARRGCMCSMHMSW